NPAGAKSIAGQILAARAQAQQKGDDLVKKLNQTRDLTLNVEEFEKMDMASLLDALEKVRQAGQLQKLRDMTEAQKVTTGILAIQYLSDSTLEETFYANLAKLNNENDRAAIRAYVTRRLAKGDDIESGPLLEATKWVNEYLGDNGLALNPADDTRQ